MGRPRVRSCASCKRLRIKCNLARPACEYCVATQRQCQYPDDTHAPLTFVPTKLQHQSQLQSQSESEPQSQIQLQSQSQSQSELQSQLQSPQSQSQLHSQFQSQSLVSAQSARLNLPHTVMGMSGFELRLLHHYNRWGDRYHQSQDSRQLVLWKQVMPQMHMTSTLIKRCVFAFSGMLALADAAPHTLGLARVDDTAPAIAHLHRFAFASFDHQVQLTSALVRDLQNDTISPDHLGQLLVSTSFVMMVVGYLPSMPMVDFVRRQGDYISLLKGTKATHWQAYHRLKSPVLEYGMSPGLESPQYRILPLVLPYFDLVNNHQLTPLSIKPVVYQVLDTLSQAAWGCSHQCTDIPLFRFFYAAPNSWYDLVYDQQFAALSLVNLLCALQLLVGYQFDRNHNMQMEYMEWYRRHNFGSYGQWRVATDEHLYEAVVTHKLRLAYADLKTFDPSVSVASSSSSPLS